ncbi:ABC transporter permease [Planobispora rosea]|uniref:ABC transporter permease n=1 Tax=Planobispora rosea TaxID=35762 RepID=A0A8J3S5H2_PLARO|nr:sugar ABC transporter permease [Planobispora rosea]GGS95881.1 ABC transporter permease [Planobispora rosea]GIH87563.1 ABC transporter permease [Planobispora rosea]
MVRSRTGHPAPKVAEPAGAAVPAARHQRVRRPLAERARRRATPYLFIAAALVLLVVFTYVPVVSMFGYSLLDWDGLDPVSEFVGAGNYAELVTRPELFGVFTVSLYYFGGTVVQLAAALYFAAILSFKVRFRNFFKGVLFFPYLINGVAIGFIFLYVFKPDGVLDTLLGLLGVEDKPLWLGDRSVVNHSLTGVSIWRYFGLNLVLFLGAIQSIPAHLFEAAQMDGATRWQQFRHIIVPGIRPVIGLNLILGVSGALSVFEIPYIMTGGANGSATFVIQTVNTAFKYHKVGLASAMAVVLLALVLIVTWIQRRTIPDDTTELS